MNISSINCFFSQRMCGSKQPLDPVCGFRWTRQRLPAGWITWAYHVSSCSFRRAVSCARFLDVVVFLLLFEVELWPVRGLCNFRFYWSSRMSINFREVVIRSWYILVFESCSLHLVLANLHLETSRIWITLFLHYDLWYDCFWKLSGPIRGICRLDCD